MVSSTVSVADLTPQVATIAGTLEDFHGDPADRMIYATARLDDLALVSKDRRIAGADGAAGSVEIIW